MACREPSADQEKNRNCSKVFVLTNVPDVSDKEEYLRDYFDIVFDDNPAVKIDFPEKIDKILVTLEKLIDIDEARKKIESTPMEANTLGAEAALIRNAVVVEGENLADHLSPFYLKLYFQKKFANGKEIVTNCVLIPETAAVAVSFNDKEVVKKVLDTESHVPLPKLGYKIQVSPFYSNYHGLIPYKNGKILAQELEHKIDYRQRLNLRPKESTGDSHRFEDLRQTPRSPTTGTPSINSAGRCDYDGQRNHTPSQSQVKSLSGHNEKTFLPADSQQTSLMSLRKTEWKLMERYIGHYRHVQYDEGKEQLVIEDKKTHAYIERLKSSIIQCTLHVEDRDRKEFLMADHIKKYLKHGLSDIEWHIENSYMYVYGFDESTVHRFRQKVEDIFRSFIKNETTHNSRQNVTHLKEDYEEQYHVVISGDSRCITILGKEMDVEKVVTHFIKTGERQALRSNLRSDKEADYQCSYRTRISKVYFRLIQDHYYPEFLHVSFSIDERSDNARPPDEIDLVITGNKKHIEEAKDKLSHLTDSIHREVIDVSREFPYDFNEISTMLLTQVEGSALNEKLKDFEKRYKCVLENTRKPCQVPRSLPHTKPTRQESGTDVMDNSKGIFSFKVNRSLELQVKKEGNIVGEPSAMLVCPVTYSKKLTTTLIGQAFHKLDPSLQDVVDRMDGDNNILICRLKDSVDNQCVAFVLLPNFYFNDPNTQQRRTLHDVYFQQIVSRVLKAACERRLGSITFPALGHGKVMKYPIPYISENFIHCLKAVPESSSLKRITFLATNEDMFNAMVWSAPKSFQHQEVSRRKEAVNHQVDTNVEITILHMRHEPLAERLISCLTSHFYPQGSKESHF